MYFIYADASAMRPKDPYLRRAACAFWAGTFTSDSAAWSLPGPVQTVYRAELFAVPVAFEVFRRDVEIVSDCKGSWTKRSLSGLEARSAPLPGTPTSGPGIGTPCPQAVFAECTCAASHPTRGRDRTAFPLVTGPGTTMRTGWPVARPSALGPRPAEGSSMTGGPNSWRQSWASSSRSSRHPRRPIRPKHRTKPRAAPGRLVAGAGPRRAPGSATSLPWSVGN